MAIARRVRNGETFMKKLLAATGMTLFSFHYHYYNVFVNG
jgi:hypothetical protein